jgi:hypothetical protein
MDNGQLETNYPNDGYSQANIAGEITNQNHLWIGDVNDNNAVPTWGTGALRGQIYGAKIYKDDQLVLNLVPAARYICDQPDSVEYGFANDLDNDGNLANDEWFGNSGTGVLTGSEEVVVSACPVNPDDAENLDSNNSTGQVILPPNTAIFAR